MSVVEKKDNVERLSQFTKVLKVSESEFEIQVDRGLVPSIRVFRGHAIHRKTGGIKMPELGLVSPETARHVVDAMRLAIWIADGFLDVGVDPTYEEKEDGTDSVE